MTDTKIKFLHLRKTQADYSVSSFGGLTVAYEVDETSNSIRYAVAKVNKTDRYIKRLGRELAAQRLADLKANSNTEQTGVITLEDIYKALPTNISPSGFAKLNVVDFDWFTTTEAVIEAVSTDDRFAKNIKHSWH